MTDVDVTGRVRAALEDAEEPLSTGAIQRRVAREGLDVATSAIRAACEELLEAGEIAAVVAPDWKFRVHETVRTSDETDAVVGTLMDDEAMQEIGEPVQAYATDLRSEHRQPRPVLSAEEEVAILRRAAWLLRDEFGADVTVRQAAAIDESGRKAEPGRPALDIRSR